MNNEKVLLISLIVSIVTAGILAVYMVKTKHELMDRLDQLEEMKMEVLEPKKELAPPGYPL